MKEVKEIPIEKIQAGEHEQRLEISDESIDGLAVSIRRVGIISPLIVEEKGDAFQLVAGHRRLLAAARVGLSVVPCVVQSGSKGMQAEVTFAENFFRENLSPVELSAALKDVLDSGVIGGKELAAGFHRTEHWVHRMVAICDWPADVLDAIHNGGLSVSAASNLACVTEDRYRNFLMRNAVEQGATARTTAAWLQAWRAMQPAEEAITAAPVAGVTPSVPLVPQAPCFCCGQAFRVNEMSHVPVCGACVQVLRQAVQSAGPG